MSKGKFYLTTAIAYTSKKPHIGNTYEIVLTDAIARYRRLVGYDVFFLTGTDEHGQKIDSLAKEKGIGPKAYVDGITKEIKSLWSLLDSSHDKFIRTTEEEHIKVVQKIFKKLYDKGDIYKGEYEGLYCVPCESFFTETQLIDNKCPDCGRPVEKTKEEAYFFKMSKYQDSLIKYIEENPEFIVPESRKKEMVNNFLKPGLQDLCVSRTSFTWGIPVSFDQKHVVYVWIDALSNYITALGYDPDGSGELFNKFWPADVHIIGKDILRFHTIYWPIMLMALELPLPKQIFGHPWLLSGEDKMSKSKGNVIYADDLIKHFGVDGIRYYLLHEMPYGQDGAITFETLINRYNSELVNTLGNLINRTVAMINKYFGGAVTQTEQTQPIDSDFISVALSAPAMVEKNMDKLRVSDAIDEIWTLIRRSNKYIDETMPWVLAKDEAHKARLELVLYNLSEAIRITAVLLQPFMPQTAKEIMRQLGIAEGELTAWDNTKLWGINKRYSVTQGEIMFPRIDVEKKLAELEPNVPEKEPQKPKQELKEPIGIEDFAKLDLRVARVTACEKVEGADKLYKLLLDVSGETRQIVSGIAKHYTIDTIVGKNVILIANLKPAKIRGVESHGMLLAASYEDKLVVCTTDGDIESGVAVR